MNKTDTRAQDGRFLPGKVQNRNGTSKRLLYSARTVRGKLERFVMKNTSPKELQKLYDNLSDRDRLYFLKEILSFILAKPQAGTDLSLDTLPEAQIDVLYNKIMKSA